MKRDIVVAIDGTAGSGKTTITLKLAKFLNYVPLLTGKLYRSVAGALIKSGKSISEIREILDNIDIRYVYENDNINIFVNNEDFTNFINSPEVENLTSRIAEIKEVRDYLCKFQRDFVKNKKVVIEGRDIGTVIAPDADVKIFMDADLEIRARRRYDDFLRTNRDISFEKVLRELEKRDKKDKERSIAPLKKAKDAIYIDTTNRNIDEVFLEVLKIVYKKMYPGKEKLRWRIAYLPAYFVFRLLFGMKVLGREYLVEKGPCVITPNHLTYWDPPFVGFACKREIYFLAKIGLFIETNRFFAWLISAFNAIPLRRGAGAIGGYEKAEKLLQEGKGICIFPEGTRSKTGKLLPFKKGAVSLACKMKVPIYPVYLKNVEKNPLDWVLRRKRLVVKIGFPLFPEDDSKDYIERLNNELRERILKLGEELEKGYNFQ